MFTVQRKPIANARQLFIALISSAFILISATTANASPASDRAFGNCVTAAAAYLETRGHQIGAVTVLSHQTGQHRLRITPATPDAEPAAIICTASDQTTAIEVISTRVAASNLAR